MKKRVNLRCGCGHKDYHHVNSGRGFCLNECCRCTRFFPAAGQRWLTHLATMDNRAPLTLCSRIYTMHRWTFNTERVNCPDCRLELLRAAIARDARAAQKASPRWKRRNRKD